MLSAHPTPLSMKGDDRLPTPRAVGLCNHQNSRDLYNFYRHLGLTQKRQHRGEAGGEHVAPNDA